MVDHLHTIEFWSGQLLEIVTSDKTHYFTQIVNHDNKNLFVQKPQTNNNVFMPIRKDMPITVYFYVDRRGLFSFESTISSAQNNRLSVIEKPSVELIKKAQRRRFFRVEAGVEMGLIVQSSNNGKDPEPIKLTTHDLSGGGLSFLYPYQLVRSGDVVEGYLKLKSNSFQKKVDFKGKVLHLIKQPNQVIRCSIEFVDMYEPVRADIIKFCMLKQIEYRKKVKNH